MELGMDNSILSGDPRLIDHIVGEVKSQGIFDQFRKECLADVDTKPAYQNLRTRVESSVNSFLDKQTWRTDLNKNQLRETLRKHIHDAPYLEVGVERIVDQVVNPKIYSVFMPQIEDVVYKFMGIEKPKTQRNGVCDLKDLLPKDLDPVSPESDRNSLKDISLESVEENMGEIVNGDEQKPNISNAKESTPIKKEIISPIKKELISPIKKEVVSPIEKKINNFENGEVIPDFEPSNSPIKTTLNSSIKSEEANKTEEEEEDSPVFEPIDVVNLNESNMSNDSHLSGISELTSHRSQSPDFMTEFSRDNFDCSNQDSQLSKVSSNSRLSIVTDFGSSNHASTPLPDSKDDVKYAKDNFKTVQEFDNNRDNKFNFEVIKNKDTSKMSNSSKENSRDAIDYKDNKKDDLNSKLKYSKDKHDNKNNKDKDRDSRRRHNNSKSDKYSRSKSRDKNENDVQESKENSNKYKDSKTKELEKKEDPSKEVKDLKDLYKEKIRELREKKELTEKEKLGKDNNKDSTKVNKDIRDKKDLSSSREKDDYKKTHKSSSSSSSRSSSYHGNKTSRNSESKDCRERSSSSKRDDRRHSNGKSDSKTSSRSKRDSRSESKSESRSNDRSLKDKKRRDEKKSKSTDDHSSLRKNSNDRRSTDRDGSNGSSSKYSHKSTYGTNNSSSKLGPSTNLTKNNNKDQHSSGEASDSVHDTLQMMFDGNFSHLDNLNKKLDPGSLEICLPLKKRPLHSEENSSDTQVKKLKLEDKKISKKKDIFKIDMDVTSVPDEERVQIIEIPDEEYEQPYPDQEPILSLEETKKIILDAEPMQTVLPTLSEMEQSIRQSLNEMMSDHKLNESENITSSALSEMEQSIQQSLNEIIPEHKLNETENIITSNKLPDAMNSTSLLEALTDDSNNDLEDSLTRNRVTQDRQGNLKNSETNEENKILNTLEELQEHIKEGNKNKMEEETEESTENIKAEIEMFDLKIQTTVTKTDKCSETSSKLTELDVEENMVISNVDNIKTEIKMDVTESLKNNIANGTHDVQKTEMDTRDLVKELEENIDEDVQNENIDSPLQVHEENIKKFMENLKALNEEIQNLKTNVDISQEKLEENPVKKTDNIVEQDDGSIDSNAEELNEDDKLVIDEEFEEREREQDNIEVISEENVKVVNKTIAVAKEPNNINIVNECIKTDESQIGENSNNTEKNYVLRGEEKSKEKEEHDRLSINDDDDKNVKEIKTLDESSNDNEILNKDSNSKDNNVLNENAKNEDNKVEIVENIQDDKKHNNNKIINIEKKDLSRSNENDNDAGKSIELNEDIVQEQIKNQLINELGKLDEEDTDIERQSEEEDVEESDIKGVKFDKKIDIVIDKKEKIDMDDESMEETEINEKYLEEIKNDDETDALAKENKDKNVAVPEDIQAIDDTDDDGENVDDKESDLIIICEEKEVEEELTLIFNEDTDTNDSRTSELSEKDKLKRIVSTSVGGSKTTINKLLEIPTTSKETSDFTDRTNTVISPVEEDCYYLECDNQKYLMFKKFLEKLEADPSRSLEKMIESFGGVVLPAVPMAAPILPPKRKLSTSPIADMLITNSNNNNDGSGKESTADEVTEEASAVIKKRKVGRVKKSSSTSTNVNVNPQPQQVQQQPQAAIVNGETFVMPLSPDSDVSASSEKNPVNTLKDDRSRHRSSQRYSSDDLYKPRPLFSSSSRRNRRFNQA